MRVLRGVVCMMKSSGLRTESWETPQEDVYEDERLLSDLKQNEGDDESVENSHG